MRLSLARHSQVCNTRKQKWAVLHLLKSSLLAVMDELPLPPCFCPCWPFFCCFCCFCCCPSAGSWTIGPAAEAACVEKLVVCLPLCRCCRRRDGAKHGCCHATFPKHLHARSATSLQLGRTHQGASNRNGVTCLMERCNIFCIPGLPRTECLHVSCGWPVNEGGIGMSAGCRPDRGLFCCLVKPEC